jgi:cytochrome c biogenesis protein
MEHVFKSDRRHSPLRSDKQDLYKSINLFRRGTMIQNTKCECGHQNHVGTVLCESCGKPLYEDESQEPLEMRYDGVARRSQRENPNWIDKVWSFFSSVKNAVYMIIVTLIGSALGTIFPQENTFLNFDPSTYYKDTYGTLGEIYYLLGLSHTFDSWWFIGLLFMIGTSLVVCSLDRVLPLYRALSTQQIRKHLNFILRQKISYNGEIKFAAISDEDESTAQAWVKQAAEQLKKQRYRVHTDGTALLAEKNRFSRWGPYINHIGLIIFLMAVLMRSIPGWHMDQHIAFPEGQIVKIPQTSYYLNLHLNITVNRNCPKDFALKTRLFPKYTKPRRSYTDVQPIVTMPSNNPSWKRFTGKTLSLTSRFSIKV